MVKSKEINRQVDPSLSAAERLIVALDFRTKDDALKLVDELGDLVGFYKVGWELFIAAGPDFVWDEIISKYRKKVFLDLKMQDIGTTMERTVQTLADRGVEFLTLHGNGATAEAAMKGRGKNKTPKFLSVTYLSSLDQTDLKDLFFRDDLKIEEYIRHRAEQVLKVGCDGLIASGSSVADLRQYLEGKHVPPPIIVTPGIRPSWAGSDDHKRTLTPSQAIESGADYLVVGRPIRNASNRVDAAKKVIAEIQEGLSR